MGDISFIVDSAASFPKEWYEQHGLYVVRLGLAFPNEKPILEFDMTPKAFYAKERKSEKIPTTSAASQGELFSVYDSALAGSKHAIMLTLLKEKSATNNVAQMVANEPDYKGKVTVVDTHTIGPAQGFIALDAMRFAESHTLEETVEHVKAVSQNARMYLVPETLKYLHAGGRVSRTKFYVGSLLRILPVISVKKLEENGTYEIVDVSKGRTMNHAIKFMLEHVDKDAEAAANNGLRNIDFAVVHSDNQKLAKEVLERTVETLLHSGLAITGHYTPLVPNNKPLLVNISPVIGAHTGPGSVGVSMLYR